MKCLELFSGTGSFGYVFDELGWDYTSLDRDLEADLQMDIMDFDYKQYPVGYFDYIHASPPCCYFSMLRNCWVGRKLKEHGDTIITKEIIQKDLESKGLPILLKTLEIIDYFKPKYWTLENPATGKMRFYIPKEIPHVDVDYCKYSDWGYKKRTRIWYGGIDNFIPKLCKNDCDNMVEIKTEPGAVHIGYKTPIKGKTRIMHSNPMGDSSKLKTLKKHKCISTHAHSKETLKSKHKKQVEDYGGGSNRLDRYRIPHELIRDLCMCIINKENSK